MTIDRESTAARASALRALHTTGPMLVLPNAWDAASARSIVAAGYRAVATTSGGVAAALGFKDGEQAPVDEMLAAAARIVAAVDVPVTVDFEAGYQLPPSEIARRLIAIGAAGLNYEDSDHHTDALLVPAEPHAERIAALKDAAHAAGVDLVINARVDAFVRLAGDPEEQLTEGLRRARLYKDAGADCIYPITLADEKMLAAFVEAVGTVNTNLRPGGPLTLDRASAIGLRRVSYASSLFREAMTALDNTLVSIRGELSA